MAKKKRSSTPGVKNIVKKAVSLKIKLGLVGFIIVILLSLFALAGMSAMFFSIGGILSQSLWDGGEEAEIPEDGSCSCGCIWVGGSDEQNKVVQVGDGTSGFVAGAVDKANVDSQVLKLIEVINAKLGDTKVPPNLIYGIANVEAGIEDLKNVYSNGETDIYSSIMKPLAGAQYYTGGDLKNGKINKPASSGAKMIGPFQIHASYYDSWVKLCPEDILTAAGGSNPTDITNRGNTGQPLYLPDVIYGHMLNASYKWSELNEFLKVRYNDWDSQPQSVKDRMLTVWYCIGYHGGNKGLKHAKDNPVIFDYFYYFSKALEQNPDLLSGLSDWGQAGKYSNVLVNTIISKVDSDGSKGLKAGFTSYASEGSTSYLIDWAYGAKVIYLGNQKFKEAVQSTGGQLTSGTTDINVPGYGPSTGSITDTSGAGELPVLTGDRKILTDKILPAAVAAEQYYNIRVLLSLCHAPKEAGWNGSGRYTNPIGNHDYNMYGITLGGGTGFKQVPHPSTNKWSHTNGHGTTNFRSYESFTESVIDHARLLASEQAYKGVAAVYSQGWEAQALALGATPYLGNDNGVSESELAKVRQEYAKKITGFVESSTGSWLPFDNLNTCMKYLEQNGLMDEYNKAVELIKSVEYYSNATVSTPSTIPGTDTSTDTSNSNNGTSGGHWVCACKKPCTLCHCHDDETENNSGNTENGEKAVMSFPEAVPGKASGLWGTTEQLTAWVEQLNANNSPLGANVAQLKANMRELLPLMGLSPNKPFKYETDKFLGPDGWGFIHYDQTSTGKEPYLKLHHQDGTGSGGTFNSSACGLYSLSMILSTLEKQWVNPAELAVAMQTYGVRNNKRINTTQMGNLGAAYWSGLLAIVKEAGYTDAKLSGKILDQAMLDDCLAKGGLVMYVTVDKDFTSGGHYVVIREKTADGKYLMGNSTRRNNNEYTFKKLQDGCSTNRDTLYVYPKPGKSINDMKNGNNSSNGGGADTSTAVQPGLLGNEQPVKAMDTLNISSSWYRSSGQFHAAIDYSTPVGTPIKAIWGGEVIKAVDGNPTYGSFSGYGGSYGNHVIIKHPNGTWSTYGHMEKNGVKVKTGDLVSQGQVIGSSGSSGNSTGPHLHLELATELYQKVVNPNKLYEGHRLSELAIRTRKGVLVREGVE